MEYMVINDEDGAVLFQGEDRDAVFKRARELDAETPDRVYIEDSGGRIYEDLTTY